jgi:DNA-binding IclR family transcriptional regulator
VLAADLSPAELESVLAGATFARMTPHTVTSRDEFLAELARVREQGWAHDREENENSINCIGAPVRRASGRAVAAVSVSVPDIVLADAQLLELLPALLTITEKISRDCGWTGGRGRAVGPRPPASSPG